MTQPTTDDINDITQKIQEWLSIDENLETRNQIEKLALDKFDNYDKLNDLLSKRIVFGTAGLRSRMEAGFNRMNDVTVLQTSQGLAEYIKKRNGIDNNNNNKQLSIVIGHDHRFNSKSFAYITIAIFLLKGFKVYYIGDDDCATPMVPFAIDKFNSLGGIMITASHNPKDDNGYKVYWSNGCQIIPPHDINIENEILNNLNPILNLNKDNNEINKIFINFKNNLIYCYNEIVSNYISNLIKILNPKPINFKIIYTAMHGIGFKFINEIISKIILNPNENFKFVKEQCNPDPNFSTVKFPNPEEKNALNLSIKTANNLGNDYKLILANDPDADRFTIAFKNKNNIWRQLSGNEIGILFTDYIINTQFIEKNKSINNIYILNSTVSSQMIESISKKLGFKFKDTLTGFKWIGNKAIELENQNFNVPFAYEEAIGFMFSTVHDKDGIAALIVFLQLYNRLLIEGLDPIEKLEQLYKIYGNFKQCNGYYITSNSNIIDYIFNKIIRIDNNSQIYPKFIGNYKVIYWRDLTIGYDSSTKDNKPELYVDPNSQMITCKVITSDDDNTNDEDDEFIRFTARGSGTEPKLKVYIEAKASTEERAQFLADDVWRTLREEWFQPEQHNLVEQRV
ncbi:Phosphoglucomutase-3 [Pichia californica]|uniref:Phosphoglucomutase-3 n=1 Tax=Pichia californica TaxID=460514 RepID=A0A9P6WHV7_9ASCO|nr:Phosphoglucomutase-3 [[Candida] californica]KAG0687176.1 Phosphoglucomutase-3 [[Candida] californica]